MTKKMISVALTISATSIVSAAAAESAPPLPAEATAPLGDAGGLELGARLAYALPVGSMAAGIPLGENYDAEVPIGVDLGYRLSPRTSLGVYVQYAPVIGNEVQTPCHGLACSAHDTSAGIEVRYRLLPNRSWDPWVALGVGYESLAWSEKFDGIGTLAGSMSGVELMRLQLGCDLPMGKGFAIGPFASMSVDMFVREGSESEGRSDSSYIVADSRALHGWFMIGTRGRYDIAL